MRQIFDLSELSWHLTGWHPNYWRGGVVAESTLKLQPDVGPIPAAVPGSVQQALRQAGLLPDWNDQLNSRQCEWVENRHWVFQTTLPTEWTSGPANAGKMGVPNRQTPRLKAPTALPSGGIAGASDRKILHCAGLDYQGVILVNGQEAGAFANAHVPYAFDLTALLRDGPNQLAIVFTDIPAYLGQIGYTSQMREFKPRFNYIWDWVPRLVQVGIWDEMRLSIDHGDAIETLALYTEYDAVAARGAIVLAADLRVAAARSVEIIINGTEGVIHREILPVAAQLHHEIRGLPVKPWQPNGAGAPGLADPLVARASQSAGSISAGPQGRIANGDLETLPEAALRPALQNPATSSVDPGVPRSPDEHPDGKWDVCAMAGEGRQPLYQVRLRLIDDAGRWLDEANRRIGFRQITWKPCAGAPPEADPWICNINGLDIFLQGFNWVPLRPNFADVTPDDYRQRLETYRALGTNILRVWGGAILEKECFYRLCDEMGILVWQEFPLSSSGLDNWPPEDAAFIAEMGRIAASYIRRRQHHPCLLLWCGGNELQGSLEGGKQGTGKPVDLSHPLPALLEKLVRKLDPTRRFLVTSASGPRFMATKENFGKGLHHDVHGPWNHAGSLESWFDYWRRDDALFRSEIGMPGAANAALIRRHGRELAWPADKTNLFWRHSAAWWLQWDEYLADGGDAGSLEAFVAWSQQRQATALAYAARACKERFLRGRQALPCRDESPLAQGVPTHNGITPQCGGLIIWMGHDCFPCPANTSVIDFDGSLKPAAVALAKVFKVPGNVTTEIDGPRLLSSDGYRASRSSGTESNGLSDNQNLGVEEKSSRHAKISTARRSRNQNT